MNLTDIQFSQHLQPLSQRSEIEALEGKILSEVAFPVSYPFKQLAEDEVFLYKYSRLVDVFANALRYVGLIAVSEYLLAEIEPSPRANEALDQLRRPSIGHWNHFLREAANYFTAQNASLIVPQLISLYDKVEQERRNKLRLIYDDAGKEVRGDRQGLISALIEIRNAERGHGGTKDEEFYRALFEKTYPLLLLLLREWMPLLTAPLYREIERDRDTVRALRLMGADNIIEEELQIPELDSDIFLIPESGVVLPLYPLFLWSVKIRTPESEMPGLFDLLLYDGTKGKKIAYFSTRSGEHFRRAEEIEPLERLLQRKEIEIALFTPDRLSLDDLRELAVEQSQVTLQAYIQSRQYLPQVYHHRRRMEGELFGFMRSEMNGFLLLSESGVGKTNLLCHFAQQRSGRGSAQSNDDAGGDVVVFYRCLSPELLPTNLQEKICRDLHLSCEFHELLQFLSQRNLDLEAQGEPRVNLILIFDAINESQHAQELFCALNELIQIYGEYPFFKVIMSCRTAVYEKLFTPDERQRIVNPNRFHRIEVEKGTGQFAKQTAEQQKEYSYEIPLTPFREEELEEVYERYRSNPEFSMSPLTPFFGTKPQMRRLMRHPVRLRMVLEAYHGKELPDSAFIGQLMHDYVERRVFDTRPKRRFIQKLVSLMLSMRTDAISADELMDADEELEKELLNYELDSPYMTLLSDGVLQESRIQIRKGRFFDVISFSFEPLFEYLLADEKWRALQKQRRPLSANDLISWLQEGQDFKPLIGVTEHLIFGELENDAFDALLESVRLGEKEIVTEPFVRVLTSYYDVDEEGFKRFAGALAEIQNETAARILLRCSSEFNKYGLFSAALTAATSAETICVQAGLEGDLAASYNNIGVVYDCQGDYQKALEFHDKAREIEERLELEVELATSYNNIGSAYHSQGNCQKALEFFSKGGEIRDCLGLVVELAQSYNNIGSVYSTQGDYRKALEFLGKAKEIQECLAFEVGLAYSYNNIGGVYDSQGDYQMAWEFYNKAKEIYERLGLEVELAQLYSNIGFVYSTQGDYRKALAYFNKGIEIQERLGLEVGLAYSYNSIGLMYNSQGDYKEALDFYNKAKEIYERLGVEVELAQSYSNIGGVYSSQGDYRKALEFFNKAREIPERLGLEVQLAYSYNNIGFVYSNQRDYQEALKFYNKAKKIYERLGVEVGLAASYNNIGSVYNSQEDYRKALEFYNKAREIRERLGLEVGLATSYNNIGGVYNSQGDYQEALKFFNKAQEICERLRLEVELADSYNNMGGVYNSQGDYQKALEFFNKAREIRERLVLEVDLATSYNNIGGVYNSQGDYQEALKFYNKVREIQERLGLEVRLAQSYNNIGFMYNYQGDFKKALAYFNKGMEIQGRLGLEVELASSCNNIGYLHYEIQEYENSIAFLEKALAIYRKFGWEGKTSEMEEKIALVETAMKSHPTATKTPMTSQKKEKKLGRNDSCPCGSGKKYKKCCGT